jgi:hypothetical protein
LGSIGAQSGFGRDKISSRHHHDSSRPSYDSPRSSYDQAPIHADLRRSTKIHPDFTATHPDLTTIYPDLTTIFPDLTPIRASLLFPGRKLQPNHSLLAPVQYIKSKVWIRRHIHLSHKWYEKDCKAPVTPDRAILKSCD